MKVTLKGSQRRQVTGLPDGPLRSAPRAKARTAEASLGVPNQGQWVCAGSCPADGVLLESNEQSRAGQMPIVAALTSKLGYHHTAANAGSAAALRSALNAGAPLRAADAKAVRSLVGFPISPRGVADLYNAAFPQGVCLVSMKRDPQSDSAEASLRVSVRWFTRSGQPVAHRGFILLRRPDGGMVLRGAGLFVERRFRGAAVGARAFLADAALLECIDAPTRQINLGAGAAGGERVGPAFWALLGFDYESSAERVGHRARLRAFLKAQPKLSPALRQLAERAVARIRQPRDLLGIADSEVGALIQAFLRSPERQKDNSFAIGRYRASFNIATGASEQVQTAAGFLAATVARADARDAARHARLARALDGSPRAQRQALKVWADRGDAQLFTRAAALKTSADPTVAEQARVACAAFDGDARLRAGLAGVRRSLGVELLDEFWLGPDAGRVAEDVMRTANPYAARAMLDVVAGYRLRGLGDAMEAMCTRIPETERFELLRAPVVKLTELGYGSVFTRLAALPQTPAIVVEEWRDALRMHLLSDTTAEMETIFLARAAASRARSRGSDSSALDAEA